MLLQPKRHSSNKDFSVQAQQDVHAPQQVLQKLLEELHTFDNVPIKRAGATVLKFGNLPTQADECQIPVVQSNI